MKRFWIAGFAAMLMMPLLFIGGDLPAEDLAAVTVNKIPGSVEEFIALRDEIGKTRQGGATMMVLAMYTYTVNPELGEKFLTMSIHRSQLRKSGRGYKGYSPRYMSSFQSRIAGKDGYKVRCYFPGTSPENGYKIPDGPYKFQWIDNPYSDRKKGFYKILLPCTGADNPRPMTLKANNRGIWKAYEFSSFTLGCRKPVVKVDDDL